MTRGGDCEICHHLHWESDKIIYVLSSLWVCAQNKSEIFSFTVSHQDTTESWTLFQPHHENQRLHQGDRISTSHACSLYLLVAGCSCCSLQQKTWPGPELGWYQGEPQEFWLLLQSLVLIWSPCLVLSTPESLSPAGQLPSSGPCPSAGIENWEKTCK